MDESSRILFRLAEEIGSVKAEIAGLSAKLDRVVEFERRLEDVEEGVAEFRRFKARVFAVLGGMSIGAGSIGGGIGSAISKLFGGGNS